RRRKYCGRRWRCLRIWAGGPDRGGGFFAPRVRPSGGRRLPLCADKRNRVPRTEAPMRRSLPAPSAAPRPSARPRAAPRARPRVEALEDRQVPSSFPITDMTVLAQQFPTHAGPTKLYLNFDGWAAKGVSAFQSTTGNRNADIHEVLYRTAEIFAP